MALTPKTSIIKTLQTSHLLLKMLMVLVTAWGDLVVLQPLDLTKSRRVALVEVSNRGGKFSPSYFNRATKGRELLANDPDYWGDGLLMEQGLTVIWVGWQFDVPTEEHTLKLYVPHATHSDGSPIKAKVRSDWTVDKTVEVLGLGHRAQTAYPAINLESYQHQLTVRDGRDAPRLLIARNQWQFAVLDKKWASTKRFQPYLFKRRFSRRKNLRIGI